MANQSEMFFQKLMEPSEQPTKGPQKKKSTAVKAVIPTALILDTSYSMTGKDIADLNAGTQNYLNGLINPSDAALKLERGRIITGIYSYSHVSYPASPSVGSDILNPISWVDGEDLEQVQMPRLIANGGTCTGAALIHVAEEMMQLIKHYVTQEQPFGRMYAIHVSDGEPTDMWLSPTLTGQNTAEYYRIWQLSQEYWRFLNRPPNRKRPLVELHHILTQGAKIPRIDDGGTKWSGMDIIKEHAAEYAHVWELEKGASFADLIGLAYQSVTAASMSNSDLKSQFEEQADGLLKPINSDAIQDTLPDGHDPIANMFAAQGASPGAVTPTHDDNSGQQTNYTPASSPGRATRPATYDPNKTAPLASGDDET